MTINITMYRAVVFHFSELSKLNAGWRDYDKNTKPQKCHRSTLWTALGKTPTRFLKKSGKLQQIVKTTTDIYLSNSDH